MKFPEPRTFRDATSPVTLIRWVLGIGTIEYPVGRPRPAISICWSVTCLIVLLNIARITVQSKAWIFKNSGTANTSYQIILIINITCGIFHIYLGQVRSKKLMDCLSKLNGVNATLNKLGIPSEYGLTLKYQIYHLIGIFLFVLLMEISHKLITLDNATSPGIGVTIGRLYITIMNAVDDYTFSNYIRYIGKHFQRLNAYLVKINIEAENARPFLRDFDLYGSWSRMTGIEMHVQLRSVTARDDQGMIQVLRTVKKIHHDLCSIAKKINMLFGVQILLSMIISFAFVTILAFDSYTICLKSTKITTYAIFTVLCNLLWIGFNASKAFYIISACSMTSAEVCQALETGEQIQELIKPTSFYEIREEVHAFSLQLMHNPLQFTACGFFTLDYLAIRTIIETVTTYWIIMAQMYEPSDVVNISTNSTVLAINSTV